MNTDNDYAHSIARQARAVAARTRDPLAAAMLTDAAAVIDRLAQQRDEVTRALVNTDNADTQHTPAEAAAISRRDYGRAFRVSRPFHSEGRTLWYVLDPEGDPVDSYDTREAAEAARAQIEADFAGPVPQ